MSTIHDRPKAEYAKRPAFSWNYWQFHWLWYRAACQCEDLKPFIRECPVCLDKVKERFKDTIR